MWETKQLIKHFYTYIVSDNLGIFFLHGPKNPQNADLLIHSDLANHHTENTKNTTFGDAIPKIEYKILSLEKIEAIIIFSILLYIYQRIGTVQIFIQYIRWL